jgi:predicted DNA-binding transcriptional regulator YafY
MPRTQSQKLKLRYVERILFERTDEKNVITAPEIEALLAEQGIDASRKSIYADIEALKHFGLDVVYRGGKGGGYFVGKRDFELPELKLLVDAALSSRLITGRKSRELIGKLSQLTSRAQARQLNRQVYVSGRAKALNETCYYNIDAIHAAINEGRKISFRYFAYDVNKRRVYRNNNQPYVRTPVAMCWNDDNYYLIAYLPKATDQLASFRVDRMTDVEALEDEAEAVDKKEFSIANYIKRTFGMYSGEVVAAKLAFHESLVSVILDHFASDTRLTDIGGGRFSINAEVSASPVFLGWMCQFGEKAEILEPDGLWDSMHELAKKMSGIYSV